MLDLTPILPWFYATLALVLTGLAGWLVLRSGAWLSAHASFLDAKTRTELISAEQSALDAGVQYVLAYAQQQGGRVHPVVNNWLLRQGAQIAIDHSQELLADNGLSPQAIADKILAKLPAGTTTAIASSAVPSPSPAAVAQPYDSQPTVATGQAAASNLAIQSVAQQEHFASSKNSTL